MKLHIASDKKFSSGLFARLEFLHSLQVVFQGGPKTLVRAGTFCVSESSNKILRHIRSKTWPEARPAARQTE